LNVVDDIVPRQRLLDHQQLELVQPLEEVNISQRVSGIGVTHQDNRRETVSHFPHNIQVPARLDLDLDTLIAGGDLFLDFREQFSDGVLDANRNATVDAPAAPSQ
jgi:hypothetical protein